MDTFTPHTVSSRKRSRANDSDDHESDTDDLNKPDWNLVWSRFIVLESLNPAEPLTKLYPFAVEESDSRQVWNSQKSYQDEIRCTFG